jgi:UDP-N-acetylglucosamine 2-epimerase (non-hydrolysing)
VVHAAEGREAVESALDTALSPRWREHAAHVSNPYGTGTASAAILDIVRTAALAPRAKHFVDLRPAPVTARHRARRSNEEEEE